MRGMTERMENMEKKIEGERMYAGELERELKELGVRMRESEGEKEELRKKIVELEK